MLVVLGIDIGGSRTRGRLSEGGKILAEAAVDGANVTALPPQVVASRLKTLIDKLGLGQPPSPSGGGHGGWTVAACSAGAASAGVSVTLTPPAGCFGAVCGRGWGRRTSVLVWPAACPARPSARAVTASSVFKVCALIVLLLAFNVSNAPKRGRGP